MRSVAEGRGNCLASTSAAAPCLHRLLVRGRRRGECLASFSGRSAVLLAQPSLAEPGLATPPAPTWRSSMEDQESVLPLYTCLDGDIFTPANKFAYYEALRSGLKALRALGINGICVDVYWGIVEGTRPGEYDWSSYKQLFALIRDEGFMAQVCLCFHGSESVPLPGWVLEAGRANPDIHYSDRAGVRCTDYVSLGVDEVPALAGRTALGCYRELLQSFRSELGSLLGSTIVDVLVGLGPDGELKYPSHPHDRRWSFPGVGEFQCYDKYMLAGLRACAQQVSQPSWGTGGPHDAGSYTVWPHQTGFFNQYGSWGSPYGKFFLQWYSDMLMQHADAVLGIAKEVLLPPSAGNTSSSSYGSSYGSRLGGGSGSWRVSAAAGAPPPLRLHAKMPGVHWWYNTACRAPELTAGYFNTHNRDGYLPLMEILSRHGVSVRLRSEEIRSTEVPSPQVCSDPERQVIQQRTVAAALSVPVGLENVRQRFDDVALGRLEAQLFDTSVNMGIELPPVQSLVFNRMCDAMFEPGNWNRFKDFVRRVRNRADTLVVPPCPCGGPGGSFDGVPSPLQMGPGDAARAAGYGGGIILGSGSSMDMSHGGGNGGAEVGNGSAVLALPTVAGAGGGALLLA